MERTKHCSSGLLGPAFKAAVLLVLLGCASTGFAQLQVCGSAAGSDQPQTNTYSIVTNDGSFEISYNMFNTHPDRLIVRYGATELADTGCVTGTGTINPSLPGGVTSGTISIEVRPGQSVGGVLSCDQGSPGTLWNYELRAVACEDITNLGPAISVPTLSLWSTLMLMLMALMAGLVALRSRA